MTNFGDILDELKQKRDELALQIHLGSMEAQQEWKELEEKWDDFSSKAHLDDTSEGVSAAVNLLGEELKKGYERLKKVI
ncbi:MAG: hypothetical protein OEU36_21560 [Gammaproteobacteria bacterium]|nr:hypothetical protein [Gammaproteobacteria bacterium]